VTATPPPARLPASFDPRRVGLDPASVTGIALLRQRRGHAVYRMAAAGRSFVLKLFADRDAAELANYALLEACGVPTPPVRARAPGVLLLEDLDASPDWRLARAVDVEAASTGRAVSGWYKALHGVGARLLAGPDRPTRLRREVDGLDADAVRDLGARLGLSDVPGWALAAASVEALTSALRTVPETLAYADFHWTNLALTRDPDDAARRAVVFDYHLLGVGPAESDVRNVVGSLGEAARAAFLEAYGPIDERALLLDTPLALLVALREAADRPALPGWARSLLEAVRSGELERCLRRALPVL
jgi:hypothetical protein